MKTLMLLAVGVALLLGIQAGLAKGRALERERCEAIAEARDYYRQAYEAVSQASGLVVDEMTGEVRHAR
jgi:hypothetical protein